jgi:uncharacterized alpha-E superfamily protein
MYRRTMQVQVKRQEVLRFLFRDPLFPRAVMHCLDAVEESLGTLKNPADALKSVRTAVRKIERVRVDRLGQSALHDFVDDLQLSFNRIHEAVAATYFLPPPAAESAA